MDDKKNNTGNRNTGNRNTGNWNTGINNTGINNAGNCNTGHWNTGNCNVGDWNTGSRNTGDCNTGSWNTGSWNTGFCNTVTPSDILVFNRPLSRHVWDDAEKPDWMFASLNKWIFKADMTDEEKEAYPNYVTEGGYLKCHSSLQHAYIEAWEDASDYDKELTLNLPNFDKDVFIEIFGFDPTEGVKKTIIIDGKEVKISKESFEELKKSLGV